MVEMVESMQVTLVVMAQWLTLCVTAQKLVCLNPSTAKLPWLCAKDKARLQRIICSAQRTIDCSLPTLQDLYISRTLRRGNRIAADPYHPGQSLFKHLPSGRRLRSTRTKTSCHKASFFPTATGLISKPRDPVDSYFKPTLPSCNINTPYLFCPHLTPCILHILKFAL